MRGRSPQAVAWRQGNVSRGLTGSSERPGRPQGREDQEQAEQENDRRPALTPGERPGKLTRADKKEHACSTCHGESMEIAIIDKLWKIPAK